MSTRNALALALATLALPCAAGATTMGTIPVDPNGRVNGSFSAPGTQTWRLYLERGRYYAVAGHPYPDGCVASVAVRAAGGKVLAGFRLFTEGDEGPAGVSLRAPYTGWYTVAVTLTQAIIRYYQCARPLSYWLDAARDCPGDATTGCTIAVGSPLAKLHFDYWGDTDAFRTALQGGKSYTLSLAAASDPECASASIAGPGGFAASAVGGTPVVFAAPTSGTYYVSARPDNCDGYYSAWYSLSLAPSP